jgi:hypothetical protein
MGLIETLPLQLCFAMTRPQDFKFQPGIERPGVTREY